MGKFECRNFNKKILSPAKLEQVLKAHARKGLKSVFTNGCFDILHEGHVTYLFEARKKGDLLIVALDTDAAVRIQKGPTRPVNPLKSRQRVIAALECVDYVTYFGGGTPLPLIKRFKPNVITKGGDWAIDKILGAKEVIAWGGTAYSLPFVKGKSTTKIVQKIRGGK